MILYFTGTGNSYFTAKRMQSEGEIMKFMKTGERIVLEEGEPLGLIFPVYFYTVPAYVRAFIEQMETENVSYVYALITCGGGIGQAGSVLKKLLREKGLTLSYVKEVLMPDNSMLFYQIPGNKGCEERLNNAENIISQAKADVGNKTVMTISDNTLISDCLGVMYNMCRKTKKFHADEKCVGCGKCAERCPENAIVMENGHPVWNNPECGKCSACINNCPVHAVQYGKGTYKRNRYTNPEYK